MSNRKKKKMGKAYAKALQRAITNRETGKTPVYEEKLRYHAYQCSPSGGCGRVYLTVDLDEGVTPAFMSCLMTQDCEGLAVSLGYANTPPPLSMPLLVEWYKPADDVVLPLHLEDHVLNGGLLRRPTADAPEWVVERMGPTFPRKSEQKYHQLTLIPGGPDEQGVSETEGHEGKNVHPAGTGRRFTSSGSGDSGSRDGRWEDPQP